MQKHTNSTLTDGIRNFNANFKKLKSDVQVCKKVNDVLLKQVTFLECQCWRNTLYSRRESAEIIGMSNSILRSALEKTVAKVLQRIGVDICEEKLESYHHLSKKRQSSNSEISRRKDCNFSHVLYLFLHQNLLSTIHLRYWNSTIC